MLKYPYQVCYVLTNNDGDIYADMNLISILSLRQSNPGVQIILLCDMTTTENLENSNHPIFKHVDEFVSIETPIGSGAFRNRYVKTSMRRYLKGSFLYLDADTLIRGDLGPIFSTTASFSAAPNHSGSGDASEIPDSELVFIHDMKWPIPDKYVNGGVLYFSDQPDVYAFADMWHQKWLDCNARIGRHYDQPSLNSALNDSCLDFAWMNQRYNAQVNARPNSAWGAVVWHIYLSDHHASPKTILDLALANFDQKRLGSSEIIGVLSRREHPWVVENVLDRIALRRIRGRDEILFPKSWERLWLADDYWGALKSVFRIIRRRTTKLLSPSVKQI